MYRTYLELVLKICGQLLRYAGGNRVREGGGEEQITGRPFTPLYLYFASAFSLIFILRVFRNADKFKA